MYSHFMLYYRNDIPAMWEAKRKKKQSENEETEGESKPTPPKHKMPAKRDVYTICRQAGETHSRLLIALDFRSFQNEEISKFQDILFQHYHIKNKQKENRGKKFKQEYCYIFFF